MKRSIISRPLIHVNNATQTDKYPLSIERHGRLTCTIFRDLGKVSFRVKGYRLVSRIIAGHITFPTVDTHVLGR